MGKSLVSCFFSETQCISPVPPLESSPWQIKGGEWIVGTADCRALNGFGARQRRRVSCRRKYYQLLTCFRFTEHGGRRHVGVRNAKVFRPPRSTQIRKNTPTFTDGRFQTVSPLEAVFLQSWPLWGQFTKYLTIYRKIIVSLS